MGALAASTAVLAFAAPAEAAYTYVKGTSCNENPNNSLWVEATYSDQNGRSQTGFTVEAEKAIRVSESKIWIIYRDGSSGPNLSLTKKSSSPLVYENAVNHNNVAKVVTWIWTGPDTGTKYLCNEVFKSD
ncbi:hypothetical protein JCM9957A_03350 [Kineosporia succinea]